MNIFHRLIALAAIYLLTLPTSAGDPSRDTLLQEAESAKLAFIQTLNELVTIESGSTDHEGLAEIAAYAEKRLQALGAETKLVQVDKDDPRVVVCGIFRGKGKLRLMSIAHLDTVYTRGTLAEQAYRQEGDKVYGPGIADDKGGAAMIFHSIDNLQKLGWDNYDTITVLLNPDEEIGSPLSGPVITEYAAKHDVVLSHEPGNIRLGTSGIGAIELVVKGHSAHASISSDKAQNALLELANLIIATHDLAEDIPGIRLNWTIANSGTVTNRIPDIATATADVRITDPAAVDLLRAAIEKRVRENHLVKGTTVEVLVRDSHRPMLNPTSQGEELATLAQSIFAELPPTAADQKAGKKYRSLEIIERSGGGTDAGYAAQAKGVAVLEGLGLVGGRLHSPGEFIHIESIVPWLYLNTRMLIELGKKYQ